MVKRLEHPYEIHVKVEKIEYRPDHPTAVIELGVDGAGDEMDKLADFAHRFLGTWQWLNFCDAPYNWRLKNMKPVEPDGPSFEEVFGDAS